MNNLSIKNQILEKVRSLATNQISDPNKITFETRIFEEKTLNSVTLLELIDFLELELGFHINEDKLSVEYFESVNEIADTFLEVV